MPFLGDVCVYCGRPATDERIDLRHKRVESVCDQCAEDIDRANEMNRRQREYDRYVDQKLSEWKERR